MANPTASNPGVISDPRLQATQNYWNAVQADIDGQTKDVGLQIPGNMKIYRERWKPMPSDLFINGKPNPALKGFSAGRSTFGGFVGRLG